MLTFDVDDLNHFTRGKFIRVGGAAPDRELVSDVALWIRKNKPRRATSLSANLQVTRTKPCHHIRVFNSDHDPHIAVPSGR